MITGERNYQLQNTVLKMQLGLSKLMITNLYGGHQTVIEMISTQMTTYDIGNHHLSILGLAVGLHKSKAN